MAAERTALGGLPFLTLLQPLPLLPSTDLRASKAVEMAQDRIEPPARPGSDLWAASNISCSQQNLHVRPDLVSHCQRRAWHWLPTSPEGAAVQPALPLSTLYWETTPPCTVICGFAFVTEDRRFTRHSHGAVDGYFIFLGHICKDSK